VNPEPESAMTRKRHVFIKLAGETAVPLAMFGFLAAYWWQAASLSVSAISFPLALTIVLVLMLVIQMALSWREIRASDIRQSPDTIDEPPRRDWRGAAIQRVAMIALAAGLFMYWRELGGTLVIYIFVLGTLLLLGERRWPMLALMPAALAVVLTYLFKSVLRVRFPDGMLPLF